LAYLANAQRVANDLPGAEESFARAWKLWQAGAGAHSEVLAEWRLLDREASLHRGRRRFREALDKLDQARAAAPPEAAGRILLNKAYTLDQMGEAERAVEVLREAAPLVDAQREPRLPCVVKFNLAANLCHLGRYAEAEALLPKVRELAAGLHNELDLVRVAWLQGRVDAGLGRTREGTVALEQVRRELTNRQMAYDAALVTLELAELYLAEGRTREVQALAEEMMWVFRSQGIHREALGALKLFLDAARTEAATVEMARRALADLEKARRSGPAA
jgi:tetratricopeptide (TPR) repeat protein